VLQGSPATAQHAQLCREFTAAKQAGQVRVVRQRADRQRPRCPSCLRGLALTWGTCAGCGNEILLEEAADLTSLRAPRYM
jgi:transposase-like protein